MNWKLLTYVMGANCILFFVWSYLNTIYRLGRFFDDYDELYDLFDSDSYSADSEGIVFLCLSGISFIAGTFFGACWYTESQKSPNS